MKFVAYDIETNGREYIDPAFRIIMICTDDGSTVRVWGRKYIQEAVDALEEYAKTLPLVGHNASMFDRAAIKYTGGPNLKCHDTMLMAYLLDEQHYTGKYKLESLAQEYLGVPAWKDTVTWDWRETDIWDDDDPRWKAMRDYCARDTRYTRLLAEEMGPRLRRENLFGLYERLLLPASRALANLFERGVGVSPQAIKEAHEFFEKQKGDAAAVLTGFGFKKPGSSIAMKKFLFQDCGIDPVFWTDGGDPHAKHPRGPQPKLDKLSLKTYKIMYPDDPQLVSAIDAKLSYSQAQKMIGTYLKNYAEFSKANADSRLHPNYSLVTTTSGRTSAFDPNIQNPPRLKAIRKCLGAPRPGYVYLQADLSQLELRMAAHVFKERNMIAAFQRDDDLHTLLAVEMTSKAAKDIVYEERQTAKIADFLLLYGAETQTFVDSAFVQHDLVFSWEEGDSIRNAFHRRWPDLFPAYNRIFTELEQKEYVTTITGMRRRFPGFKNFSDYQKVQTLREAVNDVVQSPASHLALTMLVMLEGMGFYNTAYIHDAVQVEVLDDPAVISQTARRIKHAVSVSVPQMFDKNFGVKLLVPIKCDIEVGSSWGELEKHTNSSGTLAKTNISAGLVV